MKWFQGAGTPKLLLAMAPQNHFIQLAKWFWGGGQAAKDTAWGVCAQNHKMILETLVLVQGLQTHIFNILQWNDFEGVAVCLWNDFGSIHPWEMILGG